MIERDVAFHHIQTILEQYKGMYTKVIVEKQEDELWTLSFLT